MGDDLRPFRHARLELAFEMGVVHAQAFAVVRCAHHDVDESVLTLDRVELICASTKKNEAVEIAAVWIEHDRFVALDCAFAYQGSVVLQGLTKKGKGLLLAPWYDAVPPN